MGVKKKPTLKILFRQFAISLIVMLVAAIIVPFGLEGLAVNAGLATRANLSELQVKEIIPTLTIAPRKVYMTHMTIWTDFASL